MFSPKQYSVNKLPLKYIAKNGFDVEEANEKNNIFSILQQDCALFRVIRNITGEKGKYLPHIIFVDINSGKSNSTALLKIVYDGFYYNGRHYTISERSASMTRQGMLSFVDSTIINEVNDIVGMGLSIDKTVLSKWYSYRGLMLSSCHMLEGWRPKIIICKDAYGVIKDQRINYVIDTETEFVDKDGNNRTWKQKDIAEGVRDIEINLFDGCGIHHPAISQEIYEHLSRLGDMKGNVPTSVMIRGPFLKGISHSIDYCSFFQERGIEYIQDLWGTWHDVSPGSTPMMIMNESMFKGYKYFNKSGAKRDWEHYWDMFEKHNHCIGIVKWNYSLEEEEVYRRGNYQILQDLDLEYDEFKSFANKSKEWVEKIIDGDWEFVSCFLGFESGKCKAASNYAKALLKNSEMANEPGIRKYLKRSLEKYIDGMKCGKLWLKACSRYLAPDLIMYMEHISGLPLQGCLEADEFWTTNLSNDYAEGDSYLIERNPHLSISEHVLLKYRGFGDANGCGQIKEYISHLANVVMVNCKSLVAQQMNGSDFDGDTVLLVDEPVMKNGLDRNAAIVIDTEDKASAMEDEDTPENKLKVIRLGMKAASMIGETSNTATTYHNKSPRTVEQKKKYDGYVALISIICGKCIDAAKTGLIFNIPRYISKYANPKPYFMKYVGDYYAKQKKFLGTKRNETLKYQSNMNRLCWDLEEWHTDIKWKRQTSKFDHKIIYDKSAGIDDALVPEIEKVYKDYNIEVQQLRKDELSIQRELGGAEKFKLNWDAFYDSYRNKCFEICTDKKMLVNILVKICYELYPKGTSNFLWHMVGEYVAENIEQANVLFPVRDSDGEVEYLGKKYRMKDAAEIKELDYLPCADDELGGDNYYV